MDVCKHCRKPIVRCDTVPSHVGCSSGYGWIHSNPEQWGHTCQPRSAGPYAQPQEPDAATAETEQHPRVTWVNAINGASRFRCFKETAEAYDAAASEHPFNNTRVILGWCTGAHDD